MGITITAVNPKHEFDMGYFGFFQLRKEIAFALDEEFGRNYADLARCHTQEEYAENDKAANRIIRKNHLDCYADVLDFLYMPDSVGEVGYKTCGNILHLIKNWEGGTSFRYGSMRTTTGRNSRNSCRIAIRITKRCGGTEMDGTFYRGKSNGSRRVL